MVLRVCFQQQHLSNSSSNNFPRLFAGQKAREGTVLGSGFPDHGHWLLQGFGVSSKLTIFLSIQQTALPTIIWQVSNTPPDIVSTELRGPKRPRPLSVPWPSYWRLQWMTSSQTPSLGLRILLISTFRVYRGGLEVFEGCWTSLGCGYVGRGSRDAKIQRLLASGDSMRFTKFGV